MYYKNKTKDLINLINSLTVGELYFIREITEYCFPENKETITLKLETIISKEIILESTFNFNNLEKSYSDFYAMCLDYVKNNILWKQK